MEYKESPLSRGCIMSTSTGAQKCLWVLQGLGKEGWGRVAGSEPLPGPDCKDLKKNLFREREKERD